MKKNYEVGPDGKGGWNVKKWGAKRASDNFDNQKDAIKRGRELAKQTKGELSIKNRSGQIRDKWSYGNDPGNIKG